MNTPFNDKMEVFKNLLFEWLHNNTSLDDIDATEIAENFTDELRETILSNNATAEPS